MVEFENYFSSNKKKYDFYEKHNRKPPFKLVNDKTD